MAADTTRSLSRHTCLIYYTRNEYVDFIVRYIQGGLEHDEKCVYIGERNETNEIKSLLHSRGVDVTARIKAGALIFCTSKESCLREGRFNRRAMLGYWEEIIKEAKSGGFAGVRVSGKRDWVNGIKDHSEWIKYELEVNNMLDNGNVKAICRYNAGTANSKILACAALACHPELIFRNKFLRNHYYGYEKESIQDVKRLGLKGLLNLMIEAQVPGQPGLIGVTSVGIITQISQRIAKTLGYLPHEPVGKCISLLFHKSVLGWLTRREKFCTIALTKTKQKILAELEPVTATEDHVVIRIFLEP